MWSLASHAKQIKPCLSSNDASGNGYCLGTQPAQAQSAQNSHCNIFFGLSVPQIWQLMIYFFFSTLNKV